MTQDAEKVVAEWREAMEGVTPGPWYSESVETEGSYGSGEDTAEGFDSYVVRTEAQKHYGDDALVCDALNSGTAEVHEEFDEDGTHAWDEPGRRNMAWVARCSPSGISELLALIESQRATIERQAAELSNCGAALRDEVQVRLAAEARVTALEAEKAGLRTALLNARGLIDTPVARRKHAGDEFYDDVVTSVREALSRSSTEVKNDD